jgi:hypothetical protein
VKEFANWIAATPPSVWIQTHEAWVMPTVQSIHITAIGVVLACVLMMALRVLGYAGADQTLVQTQQRFGPWLTGALWLLLGTGLILIVGEPVRELVSFSFWAKMTLVLTGILIAFGFKRQLARLGPDAEASLDGRGWMKVMAVVTLLVWIAVVVMGRLIAYDNVWGVLSPAARA